MVRSGGYRTSAQKAGKSAGQRKKRMARNRKRQNREANVYPISISTSNIRDTKFEDNPVLGIYEEDGTWYLTAMVVERTREKLIPDRQGAVKSETVDNLIVRDNNRIDPRDGLVIKSYKTKKEIVNKNQIKSTTRVDTGLYLVSDDQWGRGFSTWKVDRDKYHKFARSQDTQSIS